MDCEREERREKRKNNVDGGMRERENVKGKDRLGFYKIVLTLMLKSQNYSWCLY